MRAWLLAAIGLSFLPEQGLAYFCEADMYVPADLNPLSAPVREVLIMPISFECPRCRHQIRAKDEHAGKKGKCPSCGLIVPVPLPPHDQERSEAAGRAELGNQRERPMLQLREEEVGPAVEAAPVERGKVACPRCGSTQVSGGQKGYRSGRAAAGCLLLGPVGLLGGLFGSGEVMATCLNCGHQWKPGSQ